MNPFEKTYGIDSSLEEHAVWANDIAPWLPTLPRNAKDIWEYAFTEIFNNAIDHSEGEKIKILINKDANSILALISDDGVGIFNKIQDRLSLSDPRHAALELAKGKFTTDPNNHSGEGVFFTAQMMDDFMIFSGQVQFSHEDAEDWIEKTNQTELGTHVLMHLRNNTSRATQKIFDKFASEDGGYKFNKTIVPVKLAQYGDAKLISRSQAKRLVAGLDEFDGVVLNFDKVEIVGQAFADEIFRVFANSHPHIKIGTTNTTPEVEKMISRALNHTN